MTYLEFSLGRNPCCSGPTPSTIARYIRPVEGEGRNPCCSGPTPSTARRCRNILPHRVAIPVVVDLLLRPLDIMRFDYPHYLVAIPVVVDLLLRLNRTYQPLY